MHWDKRLSVDGITLTVIHHSTLRHLLKHVMNTSVFIIYFPPYPPTKPHLRVFDLGSPKSLMRHQKKPFYHEPLRFNYRPTCAVDLQCCKKCLRENKKKCFLLLGVMQSYYLT